MGHLLPHADALGRESRGGLQRPQFIGLSPSWAGALVGTPDKPSPILGYMQKSFWVVTDAQCARGDTKPGCEGMKELLENHKKFENVNMGGLLNPVSYGTECKDKIPAAGSTIWRIDPAQPIALAAVATLDSPTVRKFQFCQ